MVVVIVIGILAATIIPKFMGTTHDAKVATAKANISRTGFRPGTVQRPDGRLSFHRGRLEGAGGETGERRREMARPLYQDAAPRSVGQPYQYKYPGTHHATGPDLWAMDPDKGSGGESAEIGNW